MYNASVFTRNKSSADKMLDLRLKTLGACRLLQFIRFATQVCPLVILSFVHHTGHPEPTLSPHPPPTKEESARLCVMLTLNLFHFISVHLFLNENIVTMGVEHCSHLLNLLLGGV